MYCAMRMCVVMYTCGFKSALYVNFWYLHNYLVNKLYFRYYIGTIEGWLNRDSLQIDF